MPLAWDACTQVEGRAVGPRARPPRLLIGDMKFSRLKFCAPGSVGIHTEYHVWKSWNDGKPATDGCEYGYLHRIIYPYHVVAITTLSLRLWLCYDTRQLMYIRVRCGGVNPRMLQSRRRKLRVSYGHNVQDMTRWIPSRSPVLLTVLRSLCTSTVCTSVRESVLGTD